MTKMPTMQVTQDFTKDFLRVIARFKNDDVLVGIPAEKTERKENDAPGNAQLLAINEFGSPANNIPARPVMANGIRNAQDAIIDELKGAAIDALSRGVEAIAPAFNRVGIIASTSVKKAINSQEGIEPPAESTIKARKAKGFKGTKALIVTAQMRNSITHVVRSGNG